MLQVNPPRKVYDVCIIGSGAGGGTAAKVLTEGGLNVVMLEAGPRLDPDKDFKEHVWPYQLAHRGRGHWRKATRHRRRVHGAQRVLGNSKASPTPRRRARRFAGSARALKEAAPTIGGASRCASGRRISGRAPPTEWETTGPSPTTISRPTTTRSRPTSVYSGPKKMSPMPRTACFFRRRSRAALKPLIKKACDQLHITCIPSRLAILTKPLNGRDACHYCAQCGRGCRSASNFSSSQVMIPPAAATGRFTMIPNAMAREIVLGDSGKAEAVSYIDKATKSEQRVYAKAVVVAASACESARLLSEFALAKLSQRAREFVRSGGALSHRFGRQRSGRLLSST